MGEPGGKHFDAITGKSTSKVALNEDGSDTSVEQSRTNALINIEAEERVRNSEKTVNSFLTKLDHIFESQNPLERKNLLKEMDLVVNEVFKVSGAEPDRAKVMQGKIIEGVDKAVLKIEQAIREVKAYEPVKNALRAESEFAQRLISKVQKLEPSVVEPLITRLYKAVQENPATLPMLETILGVYGKAA